jgi:tRNA U34 5-methylaminomethyl-2-thiouridine-forming methyltransferase MnmC
MQTDYPCIELKTSEDGSTTLYRPELEEHYHSIHGAIQESMHVFVNAGLNHHPQKNINILEVGFGTGLNVLLSMLHGNKNNVIYHALEKYPLKPEIISKINYPQCLSQQQAELFFHKIHSAPWNCDSEIKPGFSLCKEETDLREYESKRHFDLIYFDAFAPDKQPELWTPEIFKKVADFMNQGAILTTYSTKGSVKRAIMQAGLKIEKIPGPPGKREMLRAEKP